MEFISNPEKEKKKQNPETNKETNKIFRRTKIANDSFFQNTFRSVCLLEIKKHVSKLQCAPLTWAIQNTYSHFNDIIDKDQC